MGAGVLACAPGVNAPIEGSGGTAASPSHARQGGRATAASFAAFLGSNRRYPGARGSSSAATSRSPPTSDPTPIRCMRCVASGTAHAAKR